MPARLNMFIRCLRTMHNRTEKSKKPIRRNSRISIHYTTTNPNTYKISHWIDIKCGQNTLKRFKLVKLLNDAKYVLYILASYSGYCGFGQKKKRATTVETDQTEAN